MAIPVAPSNVQPQHTTVSRYEVFRLGSFPFLRLQFIETVDDVETVPVGAVGELDGEGKVTLLELPGWAGLTDVAGRTLLEPAVTITDFTDGWATVSEPVLPPTAVQWHRRNLLGIPVARNIPGGRQWELLVQATDAAQLGVMQQLQVQVGMQLAAAVLAQLGIGSVTPEALQAAVAAAAQAGASVDTFLAQAAESLELQRRAGQLPASVAVVGNAP